MKKAVQFILHYKIVIIIVGLVLIGLVSSAIIFFDDRNTSNHPNLNNKEEMPNFNEEENNQETEKYILCDAWGDINTMYPNQTFITNDNDYYAFDTESLYSNNQNCKKINLE